MKVRTIVALLALTAGGTMVGAAPSIGGTTSKPTSVRTDAKFIINCLTHPVNVRTCESAAYDKALSRVGSATKNLPEVKRTCRSKDNRQYLAGYCEGIEDDSSQAALQRSQAGIINRMLTAL